MPTATPTAATPSIAENRFQHVDTRHSGGLRISQAWQLLFEQNEANPPFMKLTDSEISEQMIRMFPSHAPSHNLSPKAVKKNRRQFNRGLLPGQSPDPDHPVPPKVQSKRYVRLSQDRVISVSPRGRLLEVIHE
jgi:hypothetical protein